MNQREEFDTLATDWLAGNATPDQAERLGWLLEADPAARDRLIGLADVHACLATDPRLWTEISPATTKRPARRTFSARWAFAAGVLLGVVPAGLVLAFTRQTADPVALSPLPLHDGDFESGEQPGTTGLPDRLGVWGGDFGQVVDGADGGVTPFHGGRMFRFLRSHFAGERFNRSATGEVFQVIDLRGWARPSGPVAVEVAGRVNATRVPPGERYSWVAHVFAFDSDPTGRHGETDYHWLYRESLASAHQPATLDDGDPSSWQKASVELLVPPTANFLVVTFGVQRIKPAANAEPVQFPGHFLDAIEVTPLLPNAVRNR